MSNLNNSYKILGIKYDENEQQQITNEEIGKRYVEQLVRLFINYNQESLIIQAEKDKRNEIEQKGISEEEILKEVKRYSRSTEIRIKLNNSKEKDKQFICNYLGVEYKEPEMDKKPKESIREFINYISRQRDIEYIITQIETMVCNHQFLEQHEMYKDVIELYKNAYEKIKNKVNRKEYDRELEEIQKEHQKEKEIEIERKEYDLPDTTFLGIFKNESADNSYKMLYGDNKRAILTSNRYIVLKARKQEELSSIKERANLEREELIEYTLLTRNKGKSVNFISGREIEEYLKRKDVTEKEKETYFRAVIIALKSKIAMHRPMLGKIKRKSNQLSNENKFEEKYCIGLAERVKEFEEERIDTGRNKNRWVR